MRILLIDGNLNELTVNRDVLEALGHQVTGFTNAEEAVATFKSEDFELVVTELNLPRADGLELIETFGTIKPKVPVIVLTEGVSMSKAIKAVKLRALDVLIKPMDVAKMETLLREVLVDREMVERQYEINDDLRKKINALRNAVEETQQQFKMANSKMHVLEQIADQLLRR